MSASAEKAGQTHADKSSVSYPALLGDLELSRRDKTFPNQGETIIKEETIMRKLTRKLLAVLLVVTMIAGLTVTGNAAGQESLLTLSVAQEQIYAGNEIVVSVNAAVADVVADGKLVVQFNSEALEFKGAEEGIAWPENSELSLMVNDGTAGQLNIAFASVYAAKEGALVNLTFAVLAETESKISIDAENSYITDAGEKTLDAELTVKANCPSASFTDLNPEEYYHEAIDFALTQGYMNGMGGNIFSPNTALTRAQIITILYRVSGEPEVTGENPFKDVVANTWYTDAVIWAFQEEITTGITEELFAPNSAVTREQMVAFFGRYAEHQSIETESQQELDSYTDADKVSAYAVAYMKWAVETGLIKGITETTLGPAASSTRAQAATVLYRYVTLVLGEKGR